MDELKNYRKKGVQKMRPYIVGEVLPESISISKYDTENGSPRLGDMIAFGKGSDCWLVNERFFFDNYELADIEQPAEPETVGDDEAFEEWWHSPKENGRTPKEAWKAAIAHERATVREDVELLELWGTTFEVACAHKDAQITALKARIEELEVRNHTLSLIHKAVQADIDAGIYVPKVATLWQLTEALKSQDES